MSRGSLIIILFGILFIVSGQIFAQPKLPYVDVGACPFECCTYRQWIANEDTVLSKNMSDKSPIAFKVKKGEKVTGVTGVVITTKAGIVKVLRNTTIDDSNKIPVKAGETLYLLTYLGEGFYRTWHRGRIVVGVYYENSDVKQISEPEGVWWIKIKNRRGQIGWTKESGNFENQDSCGLTVAQKDILSENENISKTQIKTSNSIRRVDFRNFTYSLMSEERERKNVTVKKGIFIFGRDSETGRDGFEVEKIFYGDLDEDRQEEAIIAAGYGDLDLGHGPRSGYMRYIYIYALKDNKPYFLKLLVPDVVDSDANKAYQNYYKDDTFLLYSDLVGVEKGKLVIDSTSGRGPHFPDYDVKIYLRWDGRNFVLDGTPQRKKLPE